jgi:hypothetical protein
MLARCNGQLILGTVMYMLRPFSQAASIFQFSSSLSREKYGFSQRRTANSNGLDQKHMHSVIKKQYQTFARFFRAASTSSTSPASDGVCRHDTLLILRFSEVSRRLKDMPAR